MADDQYRRAMADLEMPDEPFPEDAGPLDRDRDPSPLELPAKAA